MGRLDGKKVAIRPMQDVLAMTTMNFADEVVPTERLDELPGDEVKTTKRELDVAQQLVESLAGPFEPERYQDTYREAVLEMIERKAQGEEIAVQPPVEEPATEAPDLMSALKASLDEVRSRGGGDEAKAPKPRRRAPATAGAGGSSNGSGAAAKKPKSGSTRKR